MADDLKVETCQTITIEVAYALPGQQYLRELQVPIGTTLLQAIEQSGLLEERLKPKIEIDLLSERVGVFGVKKPTHYVLCDGDRIEIYRPLTIDPKLARRQRVENKL